MRTRQDRSSTLNTVNTTFFHGLQNDPFNENYHVSHSCNKYRENQLAIWDRRMQNTTDPLPVWISAKPIGPIQKVEFSPLRRGFLGVMTRHRVDQTAFTVYEVHHSTSQAKKVDFEDNPDVGFTIMEYENIGGDYADYTWATLSNEQSCVITVDSKLSPSVKFISEQQDRWPFRRIHFSEHCIRRELWKSPGESLLPSTVVKF